MDRFVKSLIKSPWTRRTGFILAAPFLWMLSPFILVFYLVVEKVFKKKMPDW